MADYYVKTTGNDTTGTGSSASPYATPGKALAVAIAAAVAGYRIFLEAGDYNITTASTNVSGGCLNFSLSGTQAAFNSLIGHAVGDITTAARPRLILGAGLVATVLNTNNANSYHDIRNFEIVGNATSGAAAINAKGRSNRVGNFRVSAFTGGGAQIVEIGSNATARRFEISGGNTSNNAALSLNGAGPVTDGWVHGNAGRGVDVSNGGCSQIARVASCDHTGTSGYGFYFQANNSNAETYLDHCTEWNNAAGGYVVATSGPSVILHKPVSGGGGGYNYDNRSNPDAIVLLSPRHKANTTALYPVAPTIVESPDTLSGDPFTSRSTGDFSPAANADGAKLKDIAEAILGGTTTSYAAAGVAQPQTTGGTGSTFSSRGILTGGGL